SLKTSIKTITYLSDTGCLEIQGASLLWLHINPVSGTWPMIFVTLARFYKNNKSPAVRRYK
ncbi:hypothetical protein R9O97_00480, partial [Escherichia coli]